jgi:hypothetical protein
MRVIFVWCPLVLFLHAVIYVSAIVVLTVLPVYHWGGTGYAYFVGAVTFVTALIFAVKTSTRRLNKWINALPPPDPLRNTKKTMPSGEPVAPATPKGPGFFEVMWKYIVAAKQKICPVLIFTGKTQGGQ